MRRKLGRSRRKADNGAIPLPLALGIGLGITIVIAVPLTIWALSRSSGPKLTVVSADASRAADNNVGVSINYLVHYPSTAYAATLTSFPTLTCAIVQNQLSGPRTFSSSAEVAGTTQDVRATLTIAVPPSQHSIQGAFSVHCSLDRNGSELASASGPGVNVAPPRFTGSTGGPSGATGASHVSGSTGTTGSSGGSGTGTTGVAPSGQSGQSGQTGGAGTAGFSCPNLGGTTLFAGGKIDKGSNGDFNFVCNYAKGGNDAGQVVATWYEAPAPSEVNCPLATAGERDDGYQTSGTLVSSSRIADVSYYFYDPGSAGSVPKAAVVGLAHRMLAAADALAAVC